MFAQYVIFNNYIFIFNIIMKVTDLKSNYIPIRVDNNNKIIICYDKQYPFEESNEYCVFNRDRLSNNVSFENIKSIIITNIKNRYSDEIIAGFKYNDNDITLSNYDQLNFNRLYSLSNNDIYPLNINIGRSEDQHTITFNNKSEFDEFILAVNTFIESKRKECRETLANINWDDYTIL